MLSKTLNHLLGLSRIDAIVNEACRASGERSSFQRCARALGVELELGAEDLNRIPRRGPAIVVANHPTGFAEGVALPALLDSIRDDVMVLGHVWFRRWPELAKRMFLVDPQDPHCPENGAALRAARKWVREGHMLILFPAGRVARYSVRERRCVEGRWQAGLNLLARAGATPIVALDIQAKPGIAYRVASALHPSLGAALLGRELLQRLGRSIPAAIRVACAASALGADPAAALQSALAPGPTTQSARSIPSLSPTLR